MGPLLFLAYINDLPEATSSSARLWISPEEAKGLRGFPYCLVDVFRPGQVFVDGDSSLQWESLQQRRWKQSLVMCYKIHHQLIAIEPANYYTAGDSRTRGNHRLRQIRAKKDTYQHSFFPRSIREWNQVPSSVVDAGSLEDFKVRLNSIPWLSSQHR
jgi:hypothetical protein